jgi:hypothetical protein
MSIWDIFWNPSISNAPPSTTTTQWYCKPYSSPPLDFWYNPGITLLMYQHSFVTFRFAYRMYIFSLSPDEMASVTCHRLDQWVTAYSGRRYACSKRQRDPNLHDLCIQALLLAYVAIYFQVFSCNSPPAEIDSVTCHWLDQWSCKPCYLPLTILPMQHRNRVIYVLMLSCTFLFWLLARFLFGVYRQMKNGIGHVSGALMIWNFSPILSPKPTYSISCTIYIFFNFYGLDGRGSIPKRVKEFFSTP